MDQFDFRGTPRPSSAYQDAIKTFVHSQEVSDTLAAGTSNKQAEIDAMLERAKMANEAHIQGIEINRASQEGIAAAHDANILKIHEKDTLTAEQVDAINAANPGLNLPRVDGLPVSTAATLIGVVKTADRDASRERINAATNLRIAGIHAEVARRGQDMETRRIITANNTMEHQLEIEKLKKQGLEAAAAEKRQLEARANVLSQIQGAYNTRENKQGLPTAFDPTPGLIENPTETLALGKQIGAAGGLPKGAPVLPVKPFPSPGYERLWANTPAYQAEKATYDKNVAQWKKSIAPPSTGGGLNKGVPKEFDPITPGTPAATQEIPSAMGGFESKVGTQPLPIVPGPTAPGPPSSSVSPGPDYRLQQTDKGAKSWYNSKTGDRRLISGVQ